jgi:hypothetical protein
MQAVKPVNSVLWESSLFAIAVYKQLSKMPSNPIENRYEGTTYGFRPSRSCHDAVVRIYDFARANSRRKWVYRCGYLSKSIKSSYSNV